MPARTTLNDRQRRFAEFVVSGDPAGRAYEKAGYVSRGDVADQAGSRLLGNVKVKAYLVELRKPQKAKAVATRERKREILLEIMEGKRTGTKISDVVRAVQVDNLMTGDNQPIKVEGEITLKRVLDAINASPSIGDDE